MAAQGKKGKKNKGKTIPLTDFLASGTPCPGPGKVIVSRNRTWADEVENEDDFCYSGSRNNQVVILPTAPREVRSCRDIDEENIPKSPPYKAYIVNLHYDTNENDISELFGNIKIVDIQLPRGDRGSGRLKGFGYMEFETREDLISALMMEDTSIKGRRMRIEVSTNNDAGSNDRRFGGTDRNFENREYDPERTQGDWRSGPREEPAVPAKPSFGRNADNVPKDRGAFTRTNMDGPLTNDRENFTRVDMNQSPYTRFNADASSDSRLFRRDNMNQMVGTRDNSRDNRSFSRENMNQMVGARDNSRENQPFHRDHMNQMVGARDASRETRSFNRENMNQMVGARNYQGGGMSREQRGSGYDDRYSNRFSNRENPPRGGNYNNNYQERDRYRGGGGNRERYDIYQNNDRGHHRPYNDQRTPVDQKPLVEERIRPKLILARRSVSKTEDVNAVSVQSAIFGGATPVNTGRRERPMEVHQILRRPDHLTRRLAVDEVSVSGKSSDCDGSKSVESGNFLGLGMVEECPGLDKEEHFECKERDECHYKTPDIEAPEREVEESGVFIDEASMVDSAKDLEVEENIAEYKKEENNNDERREDESSSMATEDLAEVPERSSIFDEAAPVDTSAKELEFTERLSKTERVNVKSGQMAGALDVQHLPINTVRSNIFGGATPVDTSARDREVEQRLVRARDEKRAREKRETKTGGESWKQTNTGGDSRKQTTTGGEYRKQTNTGGESRKQTNTVGEYRKQMNTGGESRKQTNTVGESRKKTNTSRGGRPAETNSRDREAHYERPAKHDQKTRRKGNGNKEEKQTKKEEQVVKKFELAKPPAENIWHRRAAQQAANQERQQLIIPPMTSQQAANQVRQQMIIPPMASQQTANQQRQQLIIPPMTFMNTTHDFEGNR